jgi:hypothetical protein
MVSILGADHQSKQLIVEFLLAVAIPAVGVALFPPGPYLRRIKKEADRCPLCTSHDVRRSQVQSMLDHVRAMARLYPFRCRVCSSRYYSNVLPAKDGARAADSGLQ